MRQILPRYQRKTTKKSFAKDIIVLLKKKKSNNMGVKDIKIALKMKNNIWLKIEKKYKMRENTSLQLVLSTA